MRSMVAQGLKGLKYLTALQTLDIVRSKIAPGLQVL
jgi:hypothetical protein